MKGQITAFLAGITVGIILGFVGMYFFGSRYTITHRNEGFSFKIDKWTGQAWIMKYSTDKQTQTNQFCWAPVFQK